jgi:hypothetical protein
MASIGKISGLCADYSKSTLNGRGYDKIYERILNGEDFRFNEMMKRGGIPCELGHPIDFGPDGVPRTETDPTKIAVILTEVKRGGPQKLVASGDIVDTPNGRIFKTLSEFYTFGLSSRGSYEVEEGGVIEGPDGWNQDSYVFKGYDLVLLPSNVGSMLSVTEGVGSKTKLVRVARESIDVNRLAEASNVSEDQVNEALDQLFSIKTVPESSEEVPMGEVIDEISTNEVVETEGETPDVKEEDESVEVEPTEEVKEDTTGSITDGDDLSKIKADLQVALDKVEELTKKLEEEGIDKSNRNAEITKLTSDIEDLKAELDERIAESEELEEKFETLKDMTSKLLESYKKAKEIFESKGEGPTEKEKELSSELEESRNREKEATESLQYYKKLLASSKKEILAAKESLIELYSNSLGISSAALKATLGKSYQVRNIKAAAESLAETAARFPSRPVMPVVAKKRATATESFQATDEVERELMAQMKNNF